MTRSFMRARGIRLVLALLIALALTAGLAPAAWSTGRDEAGILIVQTVPAIQGARVAADGNISEANKKGIAKLPVAKFAGLDERFNAPQTRVADDRRTQFDRIRGQMANAFNGNIIEVGLRTERRVSWGFTDRAGEAVPAERLSELVLRSSTGEILTLSGADLATPRWMAASRTQQTSYGLMSKDIYWTVQSVTLDGAEMVNRSQQRFVPNEQTTWPIELLFFQARIASTDLLFGTPTGEGVEVTGPDGTVDRYTFDENGEVTLDGVPRGEYQMSVYGSGISFVRPVSLSKDQVVELQVISPVDAGLVLGAVFIGALSLILVGRRRRLGELVARRDRPHQDRPGERGSARIGSTALALALALALLVGLGTATAPAHPASAQEAMASPPVSDAMSPVPVLAYYYIWFNPTSWRRAKTDYPLLGRYSSDDEVVMQEHIRLAKQSGIEGFLVSWKNTPQLNKRLTKLAGVAAANNFKLGIVYQGLDFERDPLPVAQVELDLEYFADTYANDVTFRVLDDRPIVVWTGTHQFDTDEIARAVRPVSSRLLVLGSAKNTAEYARIARWVDGNAYYWSSVKPDMPGYQEKLRAMGEAVHQDRGLWIPPFAPGFDARLIGGTSVVPRDDGETLRRELAVARRSNPDALGLISWNEFSENSHVEPSEMYGTSSLRALAVALGATPPPAASDSSDEVAARAGVTGWGAIVILMILAGGLNLYVFWRGDSRSARPEGGPELVDGT